MVTKKEIAIENAKIGFRNFAGRINKYNLAGQRKFCVFLDNAFAKELKEDGWNIRWLRPRNPDDDPQAYLEVAVSFKNIPPKIVKITSKNKTILDVDTVSRLDSAEIIYVDLIIRPYNWEVNGKSGVRAYLKSLYATVAEDQFESKYFTDSIDVEDSQYNVNDSEDS